MSASQLSSAVRAIEERRGSSLFAFAYILPSVTRGQSVHAYVCVWLCLGVAKRVTQWYSPLPSPSLASHAYLTLQMQSCLLSFSEARCLNLSLCPIPQWAGTMRCNGSTRGLLNALQQQGRNGWGDGGCACLLRDFLHPGCMQHVCLFLCFAAAGSDVTSGPRSSLETLFWKPMTRVFCRVSCVP